MNHMFQQPGTAVALSGPNPETLVDILRPELALAIWWRPPPLALSREDVEEVSSLEMVVSCNAVAGRLAAALGANGPRRWHPVLCQDVAQLAERFASIVKDDQLKIRLEKVTTDACSKFHADYVSVRLLTTYHGAATQWVATTDTEFETIHQLGTGNVAMFKGREWQPDCAILHRSPPIMKAGDIRLLLVIDQAKGGHTEDTSAGA